MELTKLDNGSATHAGLPGQLLEKLQSVLNAGARLVTGMFGPEVRPHRATASRVALAAVPGAHHVSPGCARLSMPARLGAVVLVEQTSPSDDVDSSRRLRSASTVAALLVPRTRLSIVGDRAFPVAAAHGWNDLPLRLSVITSAPSLPTFKRRLKTTLFSSRFCSQLTIPVVAS